MPKKNSQSSPYLRDFLLPINSFRYLRSALLYIANVVFDRYPQLVAFRYYKEHILSAFEVLLQTFYIRKYGGTYSEYYFNIKRVLKNGEKEITGSKAQLFKTLLIGVIFPLVKQHIDIVYYFIESRVILIFTTGFPRVER